MTLLDKYTHLWHGRVVNNEESDSVEVHRSGQAGYDPRHGVSVVAENCFYLNENFTHVYIKLTSSRDSKG